MRYFVHFAYNGRPYHGWQRQPNAHSVQAELENAFSTLLRQTIALTGAGRTDSGVHASHMVAHFDTTHPIPENFVFQLNQFLPPSIAIQKIHSVPDDAHARFDALSRTYQYRLSQYKDPFDHNHHYYLKGSLNLDLMNEAAQILLAYEDFECFSKVHTDVKTFLCKIEWARWESHENECIFTIRANRFLRNMVRAIVGTLIEIGQGKRSLESLHHTIASKDRSSAGYSVPAHALFLTAVTYPTHLISSHG